MINQRINQRKKELATQKRNVTAKDLDKIKETLTTATQKATLDVPLRPNAVNPFTQKNSGDNTGRFIPYINWEIVPGDSRVDSIT